MRRRLTVHRYPLVMSLVCLAVAWVVVISGFRGWNDHSWAYAGLVLFVASQLT